MDMVKGLFISMQDCYQINNRILASDKRRKLHGVVHIGVNHFNAWKHLYASRRQAPRRHRDAMALPTQGFAKMTANKTATAKN